MTKSKIPDITWSHATCVVEGDKSRLRCNYCYKEFTCSINRMKHHLARTHFNVVPCARNPDECASLFNNLLKENESKKKRDTEERLLEGDLLRLVSADNQKKNVVRGKRRRLKHSGNPRVLGMSFPIVVKSTTNPQPSYVVLSASNLEANAKEELESTRSGIEVPGESSSNFHSNVKEADQHVVVPTEHLGETDFKLVGREGADKQSVNIIKRKRGRPKGSTQTTFVTDFENGNTKARTREGKLDQGTKLMGLEGTANQMGNVMKRGRGRPKGSGKIRQTGYSVPCVLGRPNSFVIKVPLKSSSRLHSNGMESEKSVDIGFTTPQLLGPEGADNQLENVKKRGRGRPKGSGKAHQIKFSKHWVPGVSSGKGAEIDAANDNLTIAEIDYAHFLNSTLEEDQALSLCNQMSNLPVEDNTNATNTDLTKAWIDHTESVSLTQEEHQTLHPSNERSNLSKVENNQGTESGNASNNSTGSQIEYTQTWSSSVLEECRALPAIDEVFDFPIVEDNEVSTDDSLIPIETITVRDVTMKSIEHPQVPDEVVARDDGRALVGIDITTQTYPSPVQKDEGPQTLESRSWPFIKSLNTWADIESLEAFKLIPQYPHFCSLENENEEVREGKAIGHMWIFVNLMERTRQVHIDGPVSMLTNKLKALTELEKDGFVVHPIRSRLEELRLEGLLKLKEKYIKLEHSLKIAENELIRMRLDNLSSK